MDLGLYGILARLALGLAVGVCVGMTGVGGGVLVIPLLTVVLGLPPSVAIGTASLNAFLTGIYATFRHLRLGTVDIRTALTFLVGAVPANLGASVLINHHLRALQSDPAALLALQRDLRLAVTLVILFSAGALLAKRFKRPRPESDGSKPAPAWVGGHPARARVTAVLSGAVVGALIGVTSIGGGILIVSILLVLYGMPPSRTVGTTLMVTVSLSLLTAAVYGRGGSCDLRTALIMAAASPFGVYYGSRLAVRMPESALHGIVVGVVVAAAALMLVSYAVR